MPKPVTLISLSNSPGAYIPMLSRLMKKNERIYQQEEQRVQENKKDKGKNQDEEDKEKRQILPRLFSLFPVPSLKWRFISLNPNSVSAFTGIKLPKSYEDKHEMFCKVFDFKRLRLSR